MKFLKNLSTTFPAFLAYNTLMKKFYWLFVLGSFTVPFKVFGQVVKIENPTVYGTIPCFIEGILKIIVRVGIPVAVFFIIYAGFLFATARGNEQQLEKAKHAITWALIGSAILLGAWILAVAVQGTLNQITGSSVTAGSCQ